MESGQTFVKTRKAITFVCSFYKQFMKHIPVFLPLVLFIIGCTPMDMFQMEPIEYSVIKYETSDLSSAKQIDSALVSYLKFLPFLDKNLIFRVAAISYPTVDPNGKQVVASGLVFHPINKKSRGVIEIMPSAHIDSEGGGTDKLSAIEGVFVLDGYTMIIPDFIGSGISKDLVLPLLMVENTGRVAWDMRRAAAQYLWDEFRYAIPVETVVMGYSLGGFSALATQKYYEAHYSNIVKIKEVYAGGGIYDLPVAFTAFAQSGFTTYPAIPKIILGFNHYYNLNLDFSKVFKGELLANYQEWYNGKYKSDEVMERIGTNMRGYLHEDFFKPFDQQNIELKKLHICLEENSVSDGWRPKAPIYMMHAQEDSLVPIENVLATVKKLRRAGANISFISYPGGHYTVGYLYFIRYLLQFLI